LRVTRNRGSSVTNNDILRRLRYSFNFNDNTMMALFAEAEVAVTREQISQWLKKDDDPAFVRLSDMQFASFLNGFINHRRGKKDGEQPKAEHKLTNNIILKKLKIALNFQTEDIINLLTTVGFKLSAPELTALFRKPDHKHYRECKDQLMRNFLTAIQQTYRPNSSSSDSSNQAAAPKASQPTRDNTPTESSKAAVSDNKPKSAKPNASALYINPNAKPKAKPSSGKKVLKLQPKDIWKNVE